MHCNLKSTIQHVTMKDIDLRKRALESIFAANAKDAEWSNPVMTWQSNFDLPTRRIMMQRLLLIMQSKGDPMMGIAGHGGKLSGIVRRLELALYIRAASLTEYINPTTLQRRIQFLIVTFHHEGLQRRCFDSHKNKRRRVILDDTPCRLTTLKIDISTQQYIPSTNSKWNLFNGSQLDILSHVLSFLSGTEVMKVSCISEFSYTFFPSCVRSLSIELPWLKCLLNAPTSGRALRSFENLEGLEIVNSEAILGAKGAHKYDAKCCAQLPFNCKNEGELIVRDLAVALMAQSYPKLRYLVVNSNFVNTLHVNATAAIVLALKSGACPALRELSFGGNFIGDAGAIEVSDLIRSQRCPELRHLDLRRNFIGERGSCAIASALAAGGAPMLQNLCLGRNIAGNASVKSFSQAIQSGNLEFLRFLGLEDNFIDEEGVNLLKTALKQNRSYCSQVYFGGKKTARTRQYQVVFAS